MPSNPQNLIRSWNTQANFSNGRVVMDRLTPPAFTRIRTPFVLTWREDNAVVANLDWGAKQFSVYLPESLRVVQGIYLKIECPATSGANFKDYSGLQVIKSIRVLSGGTEAYVADVEKYLVDYCQSLTEEQLKEFARIHLGGSTSPGSGARTYILPILLPNSPYMLRNGHDTRGFGVFPCFLGSNRLEIQITLNEAVYVASDVSDAPGSIGNGKCSLIYHQVEMTPNNVLKYSDLRGNYSIVNRRFTELTNDYQHYTAANASAKDIVRWTTSQPQGVVSEIQVIAVATGATRDRYSAHNYIKPTVMRVLADTVVQKELDEPHKVDLESWCNGFTHPVDFPAPGRICFACHCGESSHMYTGGYSMTLASNIVFELAFPSECRWKIIAVQYQRVTISTVGQLSTSLE